MQSIDDIARAIAGKLHAEGFDVAGHRGAQFIEELTATAMDEFRFSCGRLGLFLTDLISLTLVARNPLDPVGDYYSRAHVQ